MASLTQASSTCRKWLGLIHQSTPKGEVAWRQPTGAQNSSNQSTTRSCAGTAVFHTNSQMIPPWVSLHPTNESTMRCSRSEDAKQKIHAQSSSKPQALNGHANPSNLSFGIAHGVSASLKSQAVDCARCHSQLRGAGCTWS